MAEAPEDQRLTVGEHLDIVLIPVDRLREQDVNAQMMDPEQFDRLTANVAERGALESVPYCAQPDPDGPIEIVSGHHRVRAARTAGLDQIPVLLDRAPMRRGRIIAKQIAHNQLAGSPDDHVLRQMVAMIDEVDDLLLTGLPDDYLPVMDTDLDALASPHADFEWRSMTLTFLPHQWDAFAELAEVLPKTDTLAVAHRDQ